MMAVLLLEPDAAVRESLRAALARDGWSVLCAECEQALVALADDAWLAVLGPGAPTRTRLLEDPRRTAGTLLIRRVVDGFEARRVVREVGRIDAGGARIDLVGG